MNKLRFRLVFDRRRGMRVATAEHVRSCGKAAGQGQVSGARNDGCVTEASLGLLSMALMLLAPQAGAQSRSLGTVLPRSAAVIQSRASSGAPVGNLPVASRNAAGSAAYANAADHAAQDIGSADITTDGSQMLVKQNDQKVKINWETFDIGKGYSVHFEQPTNGVAWNYVWDPHPSVIQGKLTGTGEVILENHNGVIFSPTARIETARFVATALQLSKDAFAKGLRAETQGRPIFSDDDLSSLNGFVSLERGAEVKALAGGDVIMVAPKVYNEGTIETPDGQTVLAAGQRVYLLSSQDPAQRGLLVSVDAYTAGSDGTAASLPNGTNEVEQAVAREYKTVNGETVDDATPANTPGLETKTNQIFAQRGSINLVGLTVRQNGVLSATTAVKGRNGGIYLMAMKDTQDPGVGNTSLYPAAGAANHYQAPNQLGTVEIGSESKTTVTPDLEFVAETDPTTQVTSVVEAHQTSSDPFYRSRIDVVGADVRLRSGAQLTATSGNLSVLSAQNYQTSPIFDPNRPDTTGNDNSHLVVDAGASLSVAGLRDVVLPMSANQISGDRARLFQSELADSPVQRGGVLYRSAIQFDAREPVTVANVSGFYKLIPYTSRQLSTTAGNLLLESQGSTVISDGAKLDISGGSVRYESGSVTSSLLRRGDQLVRLEDAKPGVHYDELISAPSVTGGLINVPGYEQGYNAGIVRVAGSNLYMGADIKADVVLGPYQRSGNLAGSYSVKNRIPGSATAIPVDDFIDPASADLPTFAQGTADILSSQPWSYASLRPQAGRLMVGLTTGDIRQAQLLSAVNVGNAATPLPGAVPELGTAQADSYFASLTSGVVNLSASRLQSFGLGGLVLSADTVNFSSGASLTLPASSLLTLYGGQVNFDGAFRSANGTVKLTAYTAGDVNVAGKIDVSGTRLDESGQTTGTDAVAVNGGTVTVSAGHSAVLEAGSDIDVSAGIWRNSAGKVSQGAAGSVTVAANAAGNLSNIGQLRVDGGLAGFDFSSGGSIALGGIGYGLTLGGTVAESGLTLGENFFNDNGFGTFSLSALGDVTVSSSTQWRPAIKNLVYTSSRANQGGQALTQVQTLDAGLRSSLKLQIEAKDGALGPSNLTVAAGSLLDAGLGGQMKLRASGSLDVEGQLIAHGGAIDLGLSGSRGGASTEDTTDTRGYLADQVLRLGSTAVLDVSGAAKTLSVSGRTTGSVLGGGSVYLNRETTGTPVRGRVIADLGSSINISGAAADLNLDKSSKTTHISKGAGVLEVGAADGFALMGTVTATRPDASVSGGQFAVSLSREGINDFVKSGGVNYSNAERIIHVLSSNEDTKSVVDSAAPQISPYGQGYVSAQMLLGSGFDRISLRADDGIELGAGVSLQQTAAQRQHSGALRSLVFNTPQISVADTSPGVQHTLQAQYVALGNQDIVAVGSYSQPQVTAGSGSAILNVNAGLIELYGDSALQGVGQTNLSATLDAQGGQTRTDGEVRLIGTIARNRSDWHLNGSLSYAGGLSITTGQLYATTLSNFSITGLSGDSTLEVHAPAAGSSSQLPLSALGQLSLSAQDITIDGTLRQPFGAITILGENTPIFTARSKLSVSGDGLTVPVGSTVNESQWVYSPAGTSNAVNYGSDPTVAALDELPVVKGIAINGSSGLQISSAAQLQAQAGGDLLAWEFVAGVGGSTDTLTRKNVFAVIPTYSYDFAPYDTEIAANTKADGTNLVAGSKVTITTANGVLKPGSYTLLPARYAVLPGATLVSAANIGTTQTLSQALTQDDGATYVSGTLGATGTSINGGNDSRVVLKLEPAATYQAQSKLVDTSINDYLTSKATASNTAVGALPGDGGRVSLVSNTSFDWQAQYKLAASTGFAGGEFDLSMPKMAVVAEGQTAPEGYAAISAKSLNDTGAQSILLGGVRSGSSQDAQVSTNADDVLIGQDASDAASSATKLQVHELIAVAKDQLTVAAGTQIVSATAASERDRSITVQGSGAALVVGEDASLQLKRDLSSGTSSAAGAQLSVGDGAVLQGAVVQLDASKALQLADSAQVQAKTFGLGAPKLAVGGPSDDATAVVVSGNLLADIQQSTRLQLRSYSSIDWVGNVAFDRVDSAGHPLLESIILDTPAMRGVGTSDQVASITAQNIVLRNSSGVSPSSADGGSQLVLRAVPPLKDGVTGGITIGAGQQSLNFASAQVQSTGDIIFSGTGKLSTQSDVNLSAARITADSTAKHGVNSGGELTLSKNEQASTQGEHVGAGAVIGFAGQRVVQDGVVDLPSGQLSFTASGQTGRSDSVVFTKRSVTSAAGWIAQAGDTGSGVAAPGGSIKAQADQGHVEVYGTLDVSAPKAISGTDSGAAAGSIQLLATGSGDSAVVLGQNAVLKGSAGDGSDATLNGRIQIDARQLKNAGVDAGSAQAAANLDRLATFARAGGLTKELQARIREGDQTLTTTMQATRVNLSADQGSITLGNGARIDASAAAGGLVQMAAGNDVVMQDGAAIDAHSTRSGANGGDVLLSASNGHIRLQGGSIDASGDDNLDGRVVLRAGRDDSASDDASRVRVDSIAAGVKVKAHEFDIEAVRVYQGTKLVAGNSSGSSIGQKTLQADTAAFMSHQAGVLAALGSPANAQLRSGVEIQSSGDLTVQDDWNLLTASRGADNLPIFLTLRAAGSLNINGSLSDGFATATRAAASATAPTAVVGDGASMRLVAGADLSAASALATSSAGTGNLTIAGNATSSGDGKMVRTTSGSIDLVAAGDVVLGKGTGNTPVQGVAYVAGTTSTALADAGLSFDASSYTWAQYTAHGGHLEVNAGRNIISPAASQLFNNWFYHGGAKGASTVSWFSGFDSFKQGLGSFGGGSINIQADGDIKNLGVVSPTSARNASDADGHLNLLTENGGDINIHAGGNIAGGTYFLGRGEGRIVADGAITAGDKLTAALPDAKGPVLGLMAGAWSLQSNDDLTSGLVYNPTMLSSSLSRMTAALTGGYYTYASDAAMRLSSVRGEVAYNNSGIGTSLTDSYLYSVSSLFSTNADKNNLNANNLLPLNLRLASVAPPVVALQALTGDVSIVAGSNKGVLLYPSQQAALNIYAGKDISLVGGGSSSALVMADGDPSLWASVITPLMFSNKLAFPSLLKNAVVADLTSDSNAAGDRALGDLHAGSHEVHWYAGGNLVAQNLPVVLPQAASIVVGGNIQGLNYTGQNNQSGDITRIEAGGSILRNGSQAPTLSIYGDGTLLVSAGRQLDLSGGGIVALGAGLGDKLTGLNSSLSTTSAHITAEAGMAMGLNVDELLQTYMEQHADAMNTDLHGLQPSSSDAKAQAVYEVAVQTNAERQLVAALLNAQVDPSRQALVDYVKSTLHLSDGALSTDPTQAYEQALSYFKQLTPEHQVAFARQIMLRNFAAVYLSPSKDSSVLPSYLSLWEAQAQAAGVALSDYSSAAFQQFQKEVLMQEIKRQGSLASKIADSTNAAENAKRKALRADLWAQAALLSDLTGMGESFSSVGDINLANAGIRSKADGSFSTGGIDLFAPGGNVLIGLSVADSDPNQSEGLVAERGGSIRSYSRGDYLVKAQKVFVVGEGDIIAYSSKGNVDSGVGSNTAVNVPTPRPEVQSDGTVKFISSATTGSGLGILGQASDAAIAAHGGEDPRVVGLYAPLGEVRALDAYIVGPKIEVASPVVKGADNLKSGSGQSFVAPPAVSVNVSNNNQAQSSAAAQAALAGSGGEKDKTVNSLLTVDLIGLGDGSASSSDCDAEKKKRGECP